MAFKRQTYRFLSGSLNLLPPGDKIPAEDALHLQNFRVDQAGQLVARRGTARRGNNTTSPTDAHTLARRTGSIGLYIGAGAKLFRDNGGTEIFDGQTLGKPRTVFYFDENALVPNGPTPLFSASCPTVR